MGAASHPPFTAAPTPDQPTLPARIDRHHDALGRVYAARMADHDLSFKDFSLPADQAKPKRFRLDPDMFEAPAVIPPIVFAELVGMAGQFGAMAGDGEEDAAGMGKEQILAMVEAFGDLFVQLLSEGHGERFKARLLSKTEPIDLMRQAVPVLHWLIEVYGLRPTEPPSSSSNGSDGGGIGSTDGVQSEESTLSA